MSRAFAAELGPTPLRFGPRAARGVWGLAGLALALVLGALWLVGMFLLFAFPHEMTPRAGRVRLARLLEEVYHVPLDPSAEVRAAFAGRADFPAADFQSEGSDWYLAQLDPTRAAAFEARLIAQNRGFRMLVAASHVADVFARHPDLEPPDRQGQPWPTRARAWWLDPARSASAVFYDDHFFLYDSRG